MTNKDSIDTPIITRFAPSPTGHLHIGGLRTALYNYIYTRGQDIKNHNVKRQDSHNQATTFTKHKKSKNKFLLRIEDTDIKRNSKEALDGILEAFKWAGLEYDEPTLYQSQRLEIYQSYAKKLLDSKRAYYCYLGKEELEKIRESRDANHANLTRKYRDYTGTPPSNIKPSVRIKAPLSGSVSFIDGIKGEISFSASELDDFVILRSDGTPTYNFVVAIDDALSGITDLMRGDDHISNTPKQIIVYNALGFALPRFYHIPMICNEKGQKLSKRDGALSVLEYRDAGILSQALLNFLFRLGFSYGDKEIFSMQEMMECFDPCKINSKASACNFSKLYWLNAEHIKMMSSDEILRLMELSDFGDISGLDSKRIDCLIEELKPRVNNLVDFKKGIFSVISPSFLSSLSLSDNEFAVLKNKLFKDSQKSLLIESLQGFIDFLDSQNISNIDNVDIAREILHIFIHDFNGGIESRFKESRVKTSVFMQSLRLALLGQKGGIDLSACMYILGVEEIKARVSWLLGVV